ncbi:MAG: Folate-dependent protein for Fe/S cluster synthesis/repair in oxidative stress [Rhodanobacteraceae bacterium]|jgi:folate-binding protein YgfZ|nr:MAG: Folate-dependent protein for Fe/S cluster synthesis/repair in oxidative stress [Rhodanobacteraceae bacterium]
MTSIPRAIGQVTCIVIAGADARRFAQAQFSGDVDALTPGHWQWNAWLTAQGRVRALMHLADVGDGRLLAVLRGGDAEAICAGLARFVFRMRVTLAVAGFTAFAGEATPDGTVSIDADGAIMLGYGARSLHLSPVTAAIDPAAPTEWRLQDIRQGWPCLPADGEPGFLPPALGLEHLGAVAFAKGCYPGQEIAARLHYRGGHKFRLCHIHGPKPLPPGSVQGGAGAPKAWVLDAVNGQEGAQALVVVPIGTPMRINILECIYSVISMFDA